MMRRGTGLALAVAGCCLIAVACYGPTEVRLDISTDLPCRAIPDGGGAPSSPVHTLVRLGGGVDSPIVADTTSCAARAVADGLADVGSIVLVPSGDRSAHVTVEVTATADGSDPEVCGRPGVAAAAQAQCIVARRTFAFIKHTARSLPIRLYASCRGKVCDAAQTCNQTGACESAAVSDDTGCIASEPNCHDSPPPPPIDAGEAGDAPVADAADAAPPPSCVAADGTHTITTGSMTDFVAANSTRLFWVGTSLAGGATVPVMSVATQSPGPPSILFPFPTTDGAITAFAADDRAVWIATSAHVHRYDLQTSMLVPFDITSTMSLASSTARDLAGPMVTTKAYAATAGLDPASGKPFGAVFELHADGTYAGIEQTIPATAIAATNRNVSTLFIVTSKAFGGPQLSRGASDVRSFGSTDIPEPIAIATDDVDLFLSTGGSIQRIAPAAKTATSIFSVAIPGRVAVDAVSVFYEQKGSDSAIFSGEKNPINSGIITPVPRRVATGYSDVAGLTIDATCVYFWATPGIGGPATLNVFPKSAP